MHSVQVRYDVHRAREAGLTAARIIALTGVSARSQQRIAHEEISFGMNDRDFHATRRLGRPTSLTEAFQRPIGEMLAEDPTMKGAEVLRRLRSLHRYPGGKTPVYDFLQHTRPPKPAAPPIVRFEGVAGEFAQHDFGALTVRYLDGSVEELTFYAGRLKWSRALHVCLIPDETAESLIRGLEAFAQAVGGLPLINVVDNTKAAVLRRKKDPTTGEERIDYNLYFASFLREVGVLAEPTAPYSGNQKGSVENLIRFVKEGFLLARCFRNREDLVRQLGEWLLFVNEARPCDATGEIPAVRLATEQTRLAPVPFGTEGYGLVHSVVVGREARVRWGGYAYSAPDAWIGQVITVKVHREAIVLHHDGKRIVHPRTPENGKYSLLPEHREALFVKPRGAVMAKRQILLDLGPEAEAFFTELVHRRPLLWRTHDLPVLWELFEERGSGPLREAFACCVHAKTIGGEYLRAVLTGVAS
jgi:transposase